MTSNGNGKSWVPGSKPGEPNKIWVALVSAPFELLPAIVFAVFGIVTIATSGVLLPGSLDILSWLITLNWQASLGLGGVLSVLGRVGNWDRIEQAGMALFVYAFGLYGAVLIVTAIVGHTLTAMTAIGLCLAYAAAAGIRLWVLHKARVARKVAGEVQYDRDHNGDSPQ